MYVEATGRSLLLFRKRESGFCYYSRTSHVRRWY